MTSVALTRRPRPPDDGERAALPLALVSMPFAQPFRPSIQLGLLAAIARRRGFDVTTFHLGLDLAARVGITDYSRLGESRTPVVGEWLFSVAAFGDDAPDVDGALISTDGMRLDAYLTRIERTRPWLDTIRNETIPAFVDSVVDGMDWSRFRVVGFTSTFQQNTASFALARRLKALHPDIVTVFGGANFDGPMGEEWVRSIPWIDYAVTGEADDAFPALLDALASGGDATAVPGVITRDSEGRVVRGPDPVPFDALDSSPVPDYDEYFERVVALGLLDDGKARDIDIPYESARGCWWGERRHCTFCGLNGSTMRFRSKSPDRVRRELEELTRRYGSFRMEAVDNILDLTYLDELLAPLAAQGAGYELFYEIKANLSRADMKRLAEGGMYRIQPGIESLSSHVLALMQKGIRAAYNVNTLRWATYYGIGVGWNILCGFPGETEADYAEQTALMPYLHHLPPPSACAPISIDRFSPTFEDRARFSVHDLRPAASYRAVYPAHVDLMAAAYHFEGELEGALGADAYAAIAVAAEDWFSAWKLAPDDDVPSLTFWWAPGTLHIEDKRRRDSAGTYAFADPLAALYVACSDAPVKAIDVAKAVGLDDRVDEVEDALGEFCRLGLMLRDGNLFLALALPARRGRYGGGSKRHS